jgi:hypothetical protein
MDEEKYRRSVKIDKLKEEGTYTGDIKAEVA